MSNWTQTTKLIASDAAQHDEFGHSTSLDGTRAAIGAIGGNNDRGAVYIFDYDGTQWSQTATLTASDAATGDHFGWSVSLDGDRVAVGTPDNDDAAESSGSVYIFDYSAGSWSQTIKLTSSDAAYQDHFGYSVSLDGDRVFVGASEDDDNNTMSSQSGNVYVFELSNGNWTQKQKLIAGGSSPSRMFGVSVRLAGTRAAIGARANAANGNHDGGSVYIFELSNGSWTQTARLDASDRSYDDAFGFSVGLDGDRVVAGAFSANNTVENDGGAVYVFDYADNSWSQTTKLITSDAEKSSSFGRSVDVKNDMVIATMHGNDDQGTNAGATYVFELSGGSWSQTQEIFASDAASDDAFGYSVSLDGNRMLIGSFRDDAGVLLNTGSAYVFDLPTTAQAVGDPHIQTFGGHKYTL